MAKEHGLDSDWFRSAEQLMHRGKYDKVLQVIGSFESKSELKDDERLTAVLLRSQILAKAGEYKNALQLAETASMELSNLKNPLYTVDAHIAAAQALMGLRKHDNSLDMINQAESQLSTVTGELPAAITQRKAVLAGLKGSLSTRIDNPDRTKEHYEQSLKLFKELDSKEGISKAFFGLGVVEDSKGDYGRALEYYQKSLALYQELDYFPDIAIALTYISWIYLQIGKLDQALECSLQGLPILEELGNKFNISWALLNIAQIYYQKGDVSYAMDYCERILTWFDELGPDLLFIHAYFLLVEIASEIRSFEQAQQHLTQLQEISKEIESRTSSQLCRMAEAIFLKASSRMRGKVRAQEIFEQVAAEETSEHWLTVMAMLNLCEILLDELKAYGEEGVLQEVKSLGEKLSSIAQQQQSSSLVIETLILQAKLAMVDGDLTAAVQFLDKAGTIAEDKRLGLLTEKVSTERQLLDEQFEKWQQLIQSNAPYQARLEQARLADYFTDALKLASMSRG